jgi:Fur family ferric uptake transcriptional regulator
MFNRDLPQPLRLDMAGPGVYTVSSLDGGGALSGRLVRMGLVPGAEIEVLDRLSEEAEGGRIRSRRGSPGRGPVDVAVGGVRFRLGRGLSARVLVHIGRPGEVEPSLAARAAFFTLRDYKEGQKGRIQGVRGEGRFRKRLLEMGFVKGTEVYVEKYAPLFDPVEYVVKGYHVSLRREEAEKILMSEPE